jgi:hypothetical protein
MSNLHSFADATSHAFAAANLARPRLSTLLAQHGVSHLDELPDSVLEALVDQVAPKDLKYYDIKRNWTRKIDLHLKDYELNEILTRDFNLYTLGRWGDEFRGDQLPEDHETICWDDGYRGPRARYWRYTKHGACHWLVNFLLRLAILSAPRHDWRIITSDFHSTVWDGKTFLFDFNYVRIGVPPKECFISAYGEELAPGEYMKVDLAKNAQEERLERQERFRRRADTQKMIEASPAH